MGSKKLADECEECGQYEIGVCSGNKHWRHFNNCSEYIPNNSFKAEAVRPKRSKTEVL